MKLLIALLKPYLPAVHMKIINRLMADNDRLNREWQVKYADLERRMWDYRDRLEELLLSGRQE